MIGRIFSWLAGGGIAAIGKELNRAYQANLEAKNDRERIESEKQIATLHARLRFHSAFLYLLPSA